MLSSKFVRDIWLIFRRTVREGLRNPALAFIFPMFPPLIGAGLFSQLFGDIVSLQQLGTDNYASWVTAGFILMTAMAGAGFTATGLVVDAKSGYLDRLRLLPVRPAAIMLGRQLFEAARVVPAAVTVLVVSVAIGADLTAGVLGALAIVGLVALWAVAWNGIISNICSGKNWYPDRCRHTASKKNRVAVGCTACLFPARARKQPTW